MIRMPTKAATHFPKRERDITSFRKVSILPQHPNIPVNSARSRISVPHFEQIHRLTFIVGTPRLRTSTGATRARKESRPDEAWSSARLNLTARDRDRHVVRVVRDASRRALHDLNELHCVHSRRAESSRDVRRGRPLRVNREQWG